MNSSFRLAALSGVFWFGLNCSCLSAAAFEVRVWGFAERDPWHREVGAWLAVSVALDRFVSSPSASPADVAFAGDSSLDPLMPAERTTADPWFDVELEPAENVVEALDIEQLAEPDAPAAGSAPSSSGAEPGVPPRGAPGPSGASSAPSPQMPDRAPEPWRLSSAQLRGLVAAVLAQHAQRMARLGGLSDRARISAWLPELKFRAGRNTDQTLRLTPTTEDPDRWALSGGSGVRLEGELRWQFDRLVFASEEVPIERMRLVLEQQRQRGILDLLEWVFRWQVAVMQRSDPDLGPSQRLEAQLTAEQTAGALDVLSGGWFSAHVSGASTSASER